MSGELVKESDDKNSSENETDDETEEEEEFNLLGDSVQAVKKDKSFDNVKDQYPDLEKVAETQKEEEDFGLPDFTSAKDLW